MHWTHTRVRYGETDQMGVVYHANYLVYFELGRTELMRGLGLSYSDCERGGVKLPVVEAHVRFIDGARYDEELLVGTRITSVSAVRVRFDYVVKSGQDNRLLAAGHTVLASLGENGRPRRFPAEVRELLEEEREDDG